MENPLLEQHQHQQNKIINLISQQSKTHHGTKNMEITLEEIQKKFESLPENLKWAIMGANIDDKIIEIGQAQGLNVEQMGQLSLETHMVIFGFTKPEKFEESLRGSLKLPEEKTRAIVTAVNEKILKEIRKREAENFGGEEKNEEEIFNSAGIKIMSPDSPEKEIKKTESTLGSKSEEIHPILAQKLSGYTKNEIVKTEHSLENITKTTTPPPPPALNTKTGYAVDPYREKPE